MQITVPANAGIANAGGVSVQNISGAYEFIPFALLPRNPDDSTPPPKRTTETWVVPPDDYSVSVPGTGSSVVSILNNGRAYMANLAPSGSVMTVDIGKTLDITGAVHGNIMQYLNDGTALMLPVLPTASVDMTGGAAISASFSDVRPGDWFGSAVASIATVGVVEGIGGNRFDPQGHLTVAQLITMLERSQYGQLTGGSAWYSAYLGQAGRDGIIYASDNLNPGADITRAQTALIFSRFIEHFNPQWAKNRATSAPADLAETPQEYRNAVEKTYAWDLIHGDTDNRFNPNNTLTRAEASQVLYNYYSIVD